ncbi:sigma-70 family RNA polymerase sigma factor [Bacillus spizizenii]|nr:sigma-70 family RNA polymerase sigma factor [Bacillus spizizenii]MCY8907091.1 sigma-70 family RNA polymerase sigma factor [Bacillus spizizenii]
MKQLSRDKKDRKRQIESYLRNYKSYKAGIKNLQQQLDWILPGMTATYSAEEGSSGTFNITSKVENAALDRIESKQALDIKETMTMYQLIVDSIDRALEQLEENERTFVEERYFKLKSIEQVAEVMGYHEKTIQRIRNSVMDKLVIGLCNIFKMD